MLHLFDYIQYRSRIGIDKTFFKLGHITQINTSRLKAVMAFALKKYISNKRCSFDISIPCDFHKNCLSALIIIKKNSIHNSSKYYIDF